MCLVCVSVQSRLIDTHRAHHHHHRDERKRRRFFFFPSPGGIENIQLDRFAYDDYPKVARAGQLKKGNETPSATNVTAAARVANTRSHTFEYENL